MDNVTVCLQQVLLMRTRLYHVVVHSLFVFAFSLQLFYSVALWAHALKDPKNLAPGAKAAILHPGFRVWV